MEGEQHALDRGRQEQEAGRDERPARPDAQTGDAAEQRADSLARHHGAPRAGTAHRVLRDIRAENEEGRVGDEEVQGDPRAEQPDPRVLDERAPPFSQLVQEALSRTRNRLDAQLRQQQRARQVRGRVEEERRPGADGRDDRSAGRGAERKRRVACDRQVAVRLLQQLRPYDFPSEAVRRGRVERDGRAADRLKRDQLPHLGVAGDEQHAHCGAHREAGGVGGDHHRATRQSVADDAAERERRHLGNSPGGKAEADFRRAPTQVEDREGDCDRREIRAEIRDSAGGEEEPEVALAEGLHARIVPRHVV